MTRYFALYLWIFLIAKLGKFEIQRIVCSPIPKIINIFSLVISIFFYLSKPIDKYCCIYLNHIMNYFSSARYESFYLYVENISFYALCTRNKVIYSNCLLTSFLVLLKIKWKYHFLELKLNFIAMHYLFITYWWRAWLVK